MNGRDDERSLLPEGWQSRDSSILLLRISIWDGLGMDDPLRLHWHVGADDQDRPGNCYEETCNWTYAIENFRTAIGPLKANVCIRSIMSAYQLTSRFHLPLTQPHFILENRLNQPVLIFLFR